MPIDLNAVKAGVREYSPPTPHFHSLSNFNLPAPSQLSINWGRNVPQFGMLGNDTHENCTVASIFHQISVFGSYGNYGTGRSGTDIECLKTYSDYFGYNPSNPATDLGGIPNLAIEKWLDEGLTIDGKFDKAISAFKVNPQNLDEVNSALAVFGPLIIVGNLPQTVDGSEVWTKANINPQVSSVPGSYGRHQMVLLGADDSNPDYFLISTWDEKVAATKDWWFEYIVECWAIIHTLWLYSGKTLAGFDYSQLVGQANKLYLTKEG